jgi:hypothetical protein
MFTTLSLRLRIFLFFAFLACATSGLAIAGLTFGYFRLGEEHALSAFVIAGVIAVLAIFALTTWVWVLFDENVAKPVERLARKCAHGPMRTWTRKSTTPQRSTSAISARRRRRSRPT